jgi:proteic killer suppression protein
MKITPATNEMFRYVSDRTFRMRKLGKGGCKKLETRLDELQAASCLEDLRHVAGHLHELKNDRKDQLGWEIVGGKRLIILSTQDPPPRKPDGGLDWSEIKEVTLLEITDYH